MYKDSTGDKVHQLKDVVKKANLFEMLAKGENCKPKTNFNDKKLSSFNVKDSAKKFSNIENDSKATVKNNKFSGVSVKSNIDKFSNIERENLQNQSFFKPANTTTTSLLNANAQKIFIMNQKKNIKLIYLL